MVGLMKVWPPEISVQKNDIALQTVLQNRQQSYSSMMYIISNTSLTRYFY